MTVNVKLFDSLADVRDDAGDALSRAHQRKVYDRLTWFEMTQRHCDVAKRPLVARAQQKDAAIWLFLRKTRHRHAEALASWYTMNFDAVRFGNDPALLPALAHALKSLAVISLSPVANPESIIGAFSQAGWKIALSTATDNWELLGPRDFESYWKARPGKLRNTVKRKAKKADLDIQIHRAFGESVWQDYRKVYTNSWKPEEGSWAFMREFAENAGRANALRLGIAYRDDRPVAAQFWYVENGRATIYKLAYDERVKSLSPGSILSEAMFRHVIEKDAPEIIDYGTGNERYKADWMDGARPLYRVLMFNPRQPAAWIPLIRERFSGLVRRVSRD